MGKIFVSIFTLIQEVCFQSLVSCGLAGLPRYQFSAELNEMRCLDERESFVVYKSFSCCLLLSVLDTVLETKVLANKCKKIFPASICSKDLLGIIMFIIVMVGLALLLVLHWFYFSPLCVFKCVLK